MLTAEQNERLTRVGQGTPCGALMRRYWHPIAVSSQIPTHGTRQVRILGEDLVLYRDRSGTLGLVEPQCPHRLAGLVFGMPEEHGLRCSYHGWLFDEKGRCLEQPYEVAADAGSTFKDKVRLKAYPVQELGGLIFAYLGTAPAPLLPRWELFVKDGIKREIGMAIIPCNWLQTVENAMDPSHVVFLHWAYSRYALEKLGHPELQRHARSAGAAGFQLKTTVGWWNVGERRRLQIEDALHEFGFGHVLFPYTDVHWDEYQIRVPVDDEHTLHIWYHFYTPETEAQLGYEIPAQNDPRDIPFYQVPVPKVTEGGEPPWSLLDNNSGQDLVMWYTQGRIMDRSKEQLGLGDEGVILYRQYLEQQIETAEGGRDPVNVFRDAAKNECLVPPWHAGPRHETDARGNPDLTYQARKYSPVYRAAFAKAKGEDALKLPVH